MNELLYCVNAISLTVQKQDTKHQLWNPKELL